MPSPLLRTPGSCFEFLAAAHAPNFEGTVTCVHSVRRCAGPVPHFGSVINAPCPVLQPTEPPCFVEGAWAAIVESETLVAAPDQAACPASCAVKSDCLLAYWKDATQECYHTINARCASERQKSELF